MKKLFFLVLTVLLVFGCDYIESPDKTDEENVKVSLLMTGEVVSEETPLNQTRANTFSSNDCLAGK